MDKNIKEYTMEELWGKGEDEVAVTLATPKQADTLFCIKLTTGGYAMLGHNKELMEVQSKAFADTFNSIGEAEKVCRENWIDASIEEWKHKEIDEDDE